MLAIFGLRSGSAQSRDIATGECLRDGQAIHRIVSRRNNTFTNDSHEPNELLAGKDVRHNLCLNFGRAEIEDWWKPDNGATQEALKKLLMNGF